jgi:hypothetical protein
MGNYEIDHSVPHVRIKLPTGEYEYLVSEELFGTYAFKATRIFEYAYERGQSDLRRNLRKLLNT